MLLRGWHDTIRCSRDYTKSGCYARVLHVLTPTDPFNSYRLITGHSINLQSAFK